MKRVDDSKTPIEQAKLLHDEFVKNKSFDEQVKEYLWSEYGVVISIPGLFLMGAPVDLGQNRFGWYVDNAVGKLSALINAMPFYLPFITFRRRTPDEPRRVYKTDRLLSVAAVYDRRHSSLKACHPLLEGCYQNAF